MQKILKPSTHEFLNHVDEVIRPMLEKKVSRTQVAVLTTFYCYLERLRYDYSADRAYQTRPVSNGELAAKFRVTERCIRGWFKLLEELGLLIREYRKNPRHKWKNLFNRLRFIGFKDWFAAKLKALPEACFPPKKKDIINIYSKIKNLDQKKEGNPAFPGAGSIRYTDLWPDLAKKNLPSGPNRPCMDMVAQRFRENLKLHKTALDHASVLPKWINFCKRARLIR